MLRLPDGQPLVFGLRGKAFRSADGGTSWQPVATHGEATLQGGAVLADGTVVLVGQDGAVLVSRDRGRSFMRAKNTTRQAFAAAAGADGTLVLVGEGGASVLTPPEAKER